MILTMAEPVLTSAGTQTPFLAWHALNPSSYFRLPVGSPIDVLMGDPFNGAAQGALAMTTPGDTSIASKDEVEKLMKGGGARVQR